MITTLIIIYLLGVIVSAASLIYCEAKKKGVITLGVFILLVVLSFFSSWIGLLGVCFGYYNDKVLWTKKQK